MAYAVSKYESQRSKAGLGMSLLVNGGAIAALILFPSVVMIDEPGEKWRPDDLTEMPLPPPPPKPEVTQEPKTDQPVLKQSQTTIDVPKPLVETPSNPPINPGFGTSEPFAGIIGPTTPGVEAGFPKVVKPPKPVFIGPTLNQRYASGFQPIYPTSLRRQEITGDVRVKVLVGTNGRVKQVQELDATHPDFFAATEKQALRKWRFNPATKDGKKVEAWFTISVKFEMDDR